MRIFRDLQGILTALCGLFLVLGTIWSKTPFPILSVIFGSYFAIGTAYRSLRDRSLDVNFLMVFAAAGAVGVGRPLEAAVLLFLFSLSSTLEAFAMSRTKSAIEGLIRLRPDKALVLVGGTQKSVKLAEVRAGDLVRVLPFEQVPLDGKVELGTTNLNQAAMTGEAEPVYKSVGDPVFAGTQNLEGTIDVRVTGAVGDTTLEKIVDLVREAQENKASGERISQWFGQRYTFFVIFAFVVSLAVRLFLGQAGNDALYGALTLLVALSPCALVISTPAATLSALAFAAKRGILIRGGEFIEIAGTVKSVALDKTGTLTRGTFRLAEVCVCGFEQVGEERVCKEGDVCWNGHGALSVEAAEVLRMAAAVERFSTHPIAAAVVKGAQDLGVEVPEAADTVAVPGLGLTATVGGIPVQVGQRRFFEEKERALPDEFIEHVEEIQRKGMTAVIVRFGDRFGDRLAAIGLRDEPRAEAVASLAALKNLGVKRIWMLTGDHGEAAQAIAQEIGITEVHAGLMPQQKAELVQQAVDRRESVMMVGDGINDAPVLASATLGVAMGGLGSDIAMNAADVVLMQDRLDRLPLLVRLGRMTNGIIRANLFFATGVILLLVVGTILLDAFLPNYRNLILPLAVIGHEGSTVLVILNGLRLLSGPKL